MRPQFSKDDDFAKLDLEKLRQNAGLNRAAQSAPPPEDDWQEEGYRPVTTEGMDEAPNGADPELGRERQIRTWDAVDINYLERGVSASRAVCKLIARDDEGPYVGTAFLVSDRLLITNDHNLPDPDVAAGALVEFEHELNLNGDPRDTQRFKLAPRDAYWTDKSLDICVVAVEPYSVGGEPLTRYGHVPLNPKVGKIEVDERISLIHHPEGEFKQVSLRDNRLLQKAPKVLWYATDTSPGSSGAPCFSDRWEVVAVHRRGVPKTDEQGRIGLRNGRFLSREDIRSLRIPDYEIDWFANEGARVSVLVRAIRESEAAGNPLIAAWLSNLGPTTYTPVPQREVAVLDPELRENRRPKNDYHKRNGYQADFLDIEVPVPDLSEATSWFGRTSYNADTGEAELPYYNFSVWMSHKRRLAFLTATNIDGANHNERDRDEFGDDKWEYDDRLPERLQIGNWFYGSEPARYNKNYFDRGHLTRRTEPSWGPTESARLANDDTFHWTNCSPQYKDFNQRSKHWQGIEQYLLENGAVKHDKRLTLFTGPIFSEEDTEHRGVLIPKRFFKVAVYVDDHGDLVSAAYVLDQSKWVDEIDFERAASLDVRRARRSVGWLETQTGIDFGAKIRAADAADGADGMAEIVELPHLF